MKKLITVSFAMLFLMALMPNAFGQDSPIDKGSIMADGGFSFGSFGGDSLKYEDEQGNEQDGSRTLITFNPSVSYFVISNLAAGATIVFEKGSEDWGGPDNATMTTFDIGPQLRYYFDLDKSRTEVKGAIYPYVGAAFLYHTVTTNWGSENAEDHKWSGTTIGFEGGAVYMVSNAVGVFGELGYNIISIKQSEPADDEPEDGWESFSNHEFGFQIGLSFFIF